MQTYTTNIVLSLYFCTFIVNAIELKTSNNALLGLEKELCLINFESNILETVKAYRSLTHAIKINPSLMRDKNIVSILLKPLAFNSFNQTLKYNSYISQAKKNYATELLKYIPSLHLCPSEALLLTANKAMIDGLKKFDKKNPVLFADAFERMILKEKEIYRNGNIVLYHGNPRYNYALSYLHTKLHELFYGSTPDYLQLRQPLHQECTTPSTAETRINYLKKGGKWTKFHHAQQLLFCNCALTGNLNQHTLFNEDSLTFFVKEKTLFNGWKRFVNWLRHLIFGQKTKISARILFDRYNIHDLYRKYRHRIKKILNFKARGNVMLQIELNHHLAHETLFPAEPIGKRAHLLITNRKTTDPLIILNALCANPYTVSGVHKTVWALVLTKDLLLNPFHPNVFGSMKVHTYSMEQEKLEKMKQKIELLVNDIKKDLKI